MNEHLLVIDHGTQSVRAMLFDAQGNLRAKTRVPITYQSPHPGWSEADPDVLWSGVGDACRQLWLGPIPKSSIVAVSLTTQRSTVVNVDAAGRPLRPAITWMDHRRTEGLAPLGGLWGLVFRLTRMRDTIAAFQADAEANWIARHEPEIWERTHRYLLLSGFLTHRLTGNFVDSIGAQVGYIPFDFKHLRWAPSWDWKWRIAPFDRAKLPELVPPGASLGTVTRAASEATGIPEGLPVIAAAADKACEVLGAGALEPNIACLSYGTSSTVNTTQRKYVEAIPLIPPFPSALPGAYSLELQVPRGYWLVSWFRDEFGYPERTRAEALGVAPETLFDDLIRDVPPGSEGLMLQPYWAPGVKIPGPEARGAVIGFGDAHGRAHLYRAILEGIGFALREATERIASRSHTKITELRVVGGGSQSDVAMQLTADIFGLPASRAHVYEASGLGAAVDAAVGIGLHANFESAIAAMTRPGRTFEPQPAARETYERLYRDVYRQMYARLRPLYERISKIV